jgi:hypothetical protein
MNINQAAKGHNKRESQKKKKWMMMHWTNKHKGNGWKWEGKWMDVRKTDLRTEQKWMRNGCT